MTRDTHGVGVRAGGPDVAATAWTPVDLTEVMYAVAADLVALAGRHKLRLGHMPLVRGDEGQLRALLRGLMGIAVGSGRSSRSGPSTRGRTVRVSGGGAGECWWLEVADNGPGVPARLREALLVPLPRGALHDDVLGGDLATCRRAAVAHNAELHALEAPGGGAIFRVVATPWINPDAGAGGSAPAG